MSLQTNEWHISKSHKNCATCQKLFETGETLHSVIEEIGEDFQLSRSDFCDKCWSLADKQKKITNWKTLKGKETNKKPIIVDNEVLLNLFERLKESESEKNRSYAYLLALILMRKRVLVFEDVKIVDGVEYMLMKFRMKRDGEEQVSVIDPHLSSEAIISLNDDLNKLIAIGEISDSQ
jgi:hypothetical protein